MSKHYHSISSIGSVFLPTVLYIAFCAAGFAQEASSVENENLTNITALRIATEATLTCAFYTPTVEYLTPLEHTAAEEQINLIEKKMSPEQLSAYHAMNIEIPDCNSTQITPYIEFTKSIAQDIIDTTTTAWSLIKTQECNYFMDDDLLAAVDNAREHAPTTSSPTTNARDAYILSEAKSWVSAFAANCLNLGFQPSQSVIGIVALAIPIEG